MDSSGRCLFIRSNFNLDMFNVQQVMDSAPAFAIAGFSPTNPVPFRRSFVNGNGTIAITSEPAQCGAINPTDHGARPVVGGARLGLAHRTGHRDPDRIGHRRFWRQEIVYSATGAESIPETTVDAPTASFSISAEGPTTISFYALDNAGNTESTQTHVMMIDATAPEISLLAPTAGPYLVGQAINANYECSDDVSGLAVCEGTVSSGSASATDVAGVFNFAVTASDAAGNSSQQSVSYSVSYGVSRPTTSSNLTRVAARFRSRFDSATSRAPTCPRRSTQ